MPVELHASVKTFLVTTGMVTQADADAKGTDVLADLPIMDAVAVYGMIAAATKRADIEVQKEALLVTAGEMKKNNLSIENWRERAAIAASMTWPTDQDTIDELIELLDADTAPPALPADPPATQDTTEADIQASRDRNQAIRDLLDEAAKSTSKSEFPEDRELAQSFTAWLERHGVEPSQSDDLVSFDGTNYLDKSKFTTAFKAPEQPGFLLLPDGGTRYWLGKEFGKDPLVFEWAQGTDRSDGVGEYFQRKDLTDGIGVDGGDHLIDVALFPLPADGDLVWGRIYRNDDHYFFVSDLYLSIPVRTQLFPDPSTLGINVDTDNDATTPDVRIWSDGTKFYQVDASKLTKTWIDDTGPQTVLSGIEQGMPYLGFTRNDGPLSEITPTDSYISNPSPDQRAAWSANFTSQVDKLNTNNNLWGAQAGSQQVRLQEAVSVYGTYLHSMSSVIQKRDKAYEQSMPR